MTKLKDRPDWRACAAIIKDEARKMGVDAYAVTTAVTGSLPVRACRRVAIRRILAELNCSQSGLAAVWGISITTIRLALEEVGAKQAYTKGQRRSPPTADEINSQRLHERLRWAHGDERAATIMAGNDPQTNADVERWNRLGSGREAA